MSDDELIDKIARNLSANWRNMHTNEALGHQRMLAGYLLPLIKEERRKAKAEAWYEGQQAEAEAWFTDAGYGNVQTPSNPYEVEE